MTADRTRILVTTIRHAHEMLAATKSDSPTVFLAELEEHSDATLDELRRVCLDHPDDLAEAGLTYDDEHRLLHRAGDPT